MNRSRVETAGVTVATLGRDRIDLSKPDIVADAIAALRPAMVVNASAYTAVDKAESDIDAAFALNRDGPAALAFACATLGAPLVHISTDYVFDGAKPAPYVETDAKNPATAYGRSKSAGEDAVLAANANAAIIRTSWVYASHGTNFLRTMLRLAETREEVGVVADQLGRPTWARDLAEATMAVALRARDNDPAARGVLHYGGAGDAVWADFAEAIFAGAAARGLKSARVKRITTADYPTPARRPANSRLDTTKIENTLGVKPRDWREACDACLSELAAR